MDYDRDHKAVASPSTPLLMMDDNTPCLLLSVKESTDHHRDDQEPAAHSWRPSICVVAQEIKRLYTIALPMIITGLLVYGKSVISMLFMGRLGKEALAGGSLSAGIANITGYSIISGLAAGMEAIASQACGAKQWPVIGLTLQRTIAILVLTCIPISALWLNIKPILLFASQDPAISAAAATYLAFSLPDLLFQSIINPLRIYLRTQNITLPLMLSAALSLALHTPVNYLLVHRLRLGIRGVAAAAALTDLNFLASLLLYLKISGVCRKSWPGWSRACLREWRPLLGLAVPSCVSVCLEWWWYELMIVLSGLLGNAEAAVATMGILLQATSLAYIFPSALSQAVSTRVGNELGANQLGRAKSSSWIALSCAVFNGVIATLIMMTMRDAWGRAFAGDEAILSLTAAAMPVVALCELGNCPQTAVCGVLRGSARPTLAANINLGSFYGVGLPVAIFVGLVMGKGLTGLWIGLLAAQVVCAVGMFTVLATTGWEKQAKRGRELIGIQGDPEAA